MLFLLKINDWCTYAQFRCSSSRTRREKLEEARLLISLVRVHVVVVVEECSTVAGGHLRRKRVPPWISAHIHINYGVANGRILVVQEKKCEARI